MTSTFDLYKQNLTSSFICSLYIMYRPNIRILRQKETNKTVGLWGVAPSKEQESAAV